jgi:hypothetical protein
MNNILQILLYLAVSAILLCAPFVMIYLLACFIDFLSERYNRRKRK